MQLKTCYAQIKLIIKKKKSFIMSCDELILFYLISLSHIIKRECLSRVN